jgi:hypothetical protein
LIHLKTKGLAKEAKKKGGRLSVLMCEKLTFNVDYQRRMSDPNINTSWSE